MMKYITKHHYILPTTLLGKGQRIIQFRMMQEQKECTLQVCCVMLVVSFNRS